MSRRQRTMVAVRAAVVALILAAMVATILALAILARKGFDGEAPSVLRSESGSAVAISVDRHPMDLP